MSQSPNVTILDHLFAWVMLPWMVLGVKKQENEAKVIPSSSKFKVSAPQTIMSDSDLVEKLAAIDE